MPRPSHGVIGLAFIAARGLQALCLLVTLSLASRFISSMVEAQQAPPSPLIGILCVICFAILYCGTTILLYFDHQLPLIPTAGIDMLFFLALMVSSIVIGKPLSYLSCKAVAQSTTKELLENIGDRLNQGPSPTTTPDYRSWISSGSVSDCMMMKAVWGFGIALTIMFVFSAVMVAFIWKGEKERGAARKAGEA
ncbi:hypothetical protein K440DRAFT_599601 [Wilcoxina mikolae CBS 423.85]|nr:hypothetical protein K440DRAFT_599601 [Wilcoxina mikolae CBS 423.85]